MLLFVLNIVFGLGILFAKNYNLLFMIDGKIFDKFCIFLC